MLSITTSAFLESFVMLSILQSDIRFLLRATAPAIRLFCILFSFLHKTIPGFIFRIGKKSPDPRVWPRWWRIENAATCFKRMPWLRSSPLVAFCCAGCGRPLCDVLYCHIFLNHWVVSGAEWLFDFLRFRRRKRYMFCIGWICLFFFLDHRAATPGPLLHWYFSFLCLF